MALVGNHDAPKGDARIATVLLLANLVSAYFGLGKLCRGQHLLV
jgi:hypothetical protein